jgi:hypothetical protein
MFNKRYKENPQQTPLKASKISIVKDTPRKEPLREYRDDRLSLKKDCSRESIKDGSLRKPRESDYIETLYRKYLGSEEKGVLDQSNIRDIRDTRDAREHK